MAKAAFDTVAGNLARLSREELLELRTMVDALLTIEDEPDRDEQPERNGKARRTATGHIEAKTINGCGPYLYLRYWSGKTLKSHYIGRAKEGIGT